MTPGHYTRRKLKSLLKKNYNLYHWAPYDAAINVINEGYIYSKATLFSMYFPDLSKLTHIKANNAHSEAKNGFTDYVFLGNTNWISAGLKSFYGDVCFVIRPEILLPYREFFVFPFNTGRNLLNATESQQASDLTILMNALEENHPCYEILVRRRIKIFNKYIKKILCNSEIINAVSKCLKENNIHDIPIEFFENVTEAHSNFDSIELIDPLDKNQERHAYQRESFFQKDNMLYVRTKFSNCILQVEVTKEKELIDPFTKKIIGQLKNEIVAI